MEDYKLSMESNSCNGATVTGTPVLSIVMPVFNHPTDLKEMIESPELTPVLSAMQAGLEMDGLGQWFSRLGTAGCG